MNVALGPDTRREVFRDLAQPGFDHPGSFRDPRGREAVRALRRQNLSRRFQHGGDERSGAGLLRLFPR